MSAPAEAPCYPRHRSIVREAKGTFATGGTDSLMASYGRIFVAGSIFASSNWNKPLLLGRNRRLM